KPVIICVGTDLSIGDSLGPIVGTMLKDCGLNAFIYGKLSETITAKEIRAVKNFVEKCHPYSKTLVIDEIELFEFAPTQIVIRVVCSKGTYIRALARDIGLALESGGHLTALRRTRVGDATIEKCQSVDDVISFLDTVELPPVPDDYPNKK
ncbi:MAG: DUF1256 domain-containing protein, partial [Muribaculaceae bacterium]|nr:DUF1256 domain-containing protein [Muribaculaceae bacterium]